MDAETVSRLSLIALLDRLRKREEERIRQQEKKGDK
jgi:hypothetical protein